MSSLKVKTSNVAMNASCSRPGEMVADVDARVVAHDWVNAEYKHLVLEGGEPAAKAAAGQFFQIECPHTAADKPFLRRPMSVYKSDAALGQVEFLYKVTGVGTRGLASLKVGRRVRILGPLGVGFHLDPAWRSIVVVGRGVGLATLAPLAELAAAQGVGVTAIISARGGEQVMSVARFEATGADIHVVLDTDRSSDPANVARIVREAAAGGRADALFTCGSNRLMLLLQKLAGELGLAGQVALEQQMACGLGMCFCCVRNFKTERGIESRRVCWEGPVFDLKEPLSW